MRSAPVLDRDAAGTSDIAVDELLVLWQHPRTREIVPIGRFRHEGQHYTFVYTKAVETVDGFRPLLGLDLRARYSSDRLPAVFSQRIMSSDRPDYGPYLETLGLRADLASPWEQIVRSGGSRAGDTLQFMPMPTVVDGRARARFLVNGIRHVPGVERELPGRTVRVTREELDAALRGLRQGDRVTLEPQSDNPVDDDAVIVSVGMAPVGWVPRALSSDVRRLLAQGPVTATVHRIASPDAPPHLRLVLDVDAVVGSTFGFDRDGRWVPLADPGTD